MDDLYLLLLFVTVPTSAFMLAELLHSKGARIFLLGFSAPMIAIVGNSIFRQADGSWSSVASRIAFVLCGGLTLLADSAPVRFFWAFRVLSGIILLELLINAVLTRTGDRLGPWLAAGIVGLPCLWFAWKGRVWPAKNRLHVVMKETSVPALELWEHALRGAGFDLKLEARGGLREHTGRLSVVFCGRATGFQFEVTPLSRLVSTAEIYGETAKMLGDGRVSANFRYSNEEEHQAAIVAAAALTQLTAGQMYAPEHEDWSDGDDAIEAAHDLVHPLELHVLLHDENLPTSEEWHKALNESGLELALPETFDVRTHAGFLPIVFRGVATGFAFALSPSQFVVGGDHPPSDHPPAEIDGLTVTANFRFGDGPQSAAAPIAAAIFARLSDGIVYNPRKAKFSRGDAAFEAATENMRERLGS